MDQPQSTKPLESLALRLLAMCNSHCSCLVRPIAILRSSPSLIGSTSCGQMRMSTCPSGVARTSVLARRSRGSKVVWCWKWSRRASRACDSQTGRRSSSRRTCRSGVRCPCRSSRTSNAAAEEEMFLTWEVIDRLTMLAKHHVEDGPHGSSAMKPG
jgi:hypothetical protein